MIEELKALAEKATPGPWDLCQHLKSVDADNACSCGYRGVVFGPEHDVAMAVFQPGHERPVREEEWGSEPPRYPREVEIANSHLIVALVNNLPAILSALEAVPVMKEALEDIMVGGNHLALLIGADHPPYTSDPQEALEHYGAGDTYEVWCCWRSIMLARQALAALEGK